MNILNFQYFFFLAVIGVANMMPVIVSVCPYLNYFHQFPLDAGYSIGKERFFGKGKTIGGFLWAILGGGVFGLILGSIFLIKIDYLEVFIYSTVLAFGAITGDLLKSFLKRRIGKKSGASWPGFDQLDFVIGAFAFALLFGYSIPWEYLLWSILIIPPAHLLANLTAYGLGWKKVWW